MHVNGQHNRIEYNTNVFINSDSDSGEISTWKQRLISILERVPALEDRIKPLIQFIVSVMAPTKIYMLKHKDTEGKTPGGYIDLLIVISSKNGVPFAELEPILDILYLKDQRVSGSLHSEGGIIEGLRNGHIFYSLNCIPENLIYDDKAITYPVTTPEALQEIKNNMKDRFVEVFEKAQDFYMSATYLNSSHPSRIVAFMLHQAVELTYRGILQSLNGYEKKTHEIRVWKKHVRRCAPQLNAIFPDDTEEEKRLLDILENAYPDARYASQYEIQESDLSILFERAKAVQSTAKQIIDDRL